MIKFNPINHSYTNSENSIYNSVTSILKLLSTTDWIKVKTKYAEKHNITVDEVTKLWEEAAFNGTKAHAILESKITNIPYETILERDISNNKIIESVNLNSFDLVGSYPELIVYSDKYKVAGKIDLPIFNKDKTFTIIDYKTDKEIMFEPTSFWNKRNGRKEIQYFIYPISHIPDINWNKYQLQISIYAVILESYGYKFTGGEIHHVKLERDKNGKIILDNEEKPIINDIIKYPIKYLKTEAIKILKNNIIN